MTPITARPLLMSVFISILLAGCVSTHSKLNISEMSPENLQQTNKILEEKYTENPNNKRLVLDYAHVLKASGQKEKAAIVLETFVKSNIDDAEAVSEYGKILAANNQFQAANIALARASELNPSDWKNHSIRGTVLDQMGQLEQAREAYKQALTLKPGEPSVLSNMAFSFALSKDLPQANALIQKAAAHPQADQRVRMNLALITGISGNMKEAERIMRKELPPKEAESNIAALKSMLKQQNTWAKLQQLDENNSGDDLTASIPNTQSIYVDEMGNPITTPQNVHSKISIEPNKSPNWQMMMDKPTVKGKAVE